MVVHMVESPACCSVVVAAEATMQKIVENRM